MTKIINYRIIVKISLTSHIARMLLHRCYDYKLLDGNRCVIKIDGSECSAVSGIYEWFKLPLDAGVSTISTANTL